MKRFITYSKDSAYLIQQLKVALIVLVLLFSCQTVFSQTYEFPSSANTVSFPIGTVLKVEVWGAGGRGGSRASNSGSYGGGGGGAYASSIVTVSQTGAYRVNIGAGSTNNSNPGGDSWFATNNNVNNALVLAKGGSSVPNNSTTGAAGGNYAQCIGDVRYNGGRGANGVHNDYGGGGGGSSAGATGVGVNAISQFGAVGPSGYDGIGGNGQTGNGNGSPGLVPGGGGGGARRTSGNAAGGNGANGFVKITVLGPQSNVTETGLTEWVAPAGVTAVEVETWGGGGRGGSRTGGSNVGRGGGGGGAYSRGIVSVTPGQTYYINVGVGSNNNSNPGGDSWFNAVGSAPTSDSFVLAKGGISGGNNTTGATGGQANAGYGQVKNSGGTGANGVDGGSRRGGGGGSSAGPSADGNDGNNATGGTAPAGGGPGGNGATSDGNGSAATPPPGGGGGGARRGNSGSPTGGAGANGQVVIHTFYNLSITKTVSNTTPLVGENITFTITVTNNGSNTARGLEVIDFLPNGLTYVSSTNGGVYDAGAGTVTWSGFSLEPSAWASAEITATVNPTGSYANTANLTANLTNIGSSTSTITVFPQQPVANLQLTKEVDDSMPLIGENVEFTLTAYNAGPQDATGVEVVDILPFGFSHVSNSGGYDTGTGIWTIGSLNSGATATLTLTAVVNPTGNHYNQAVISGDLTDPDLSNNTSGIRVYPMYPLTEIILPCGVTTYDLTGITIATPPPGAEISWHTESPADDSNKIDTPNTVRAGQQYYVAFYDPVANCYGATSEVNIKRSCLITNPMIRQRTRS